MENNQMQLWSFWAIGKPTKKPLTEALRPAAPDEHQPGCFALEEEGALIGTAAGQPYRPLKKLDQVCDPRG